MKEYINQIFYEGLGTSLYIPIENKIKKINNKKINKILIYFYKVIYFIVAIAIAVGIFYIKI